MRIKDNTLNWQLNVISRIIVGLVFIFSSFVKGVDPLGTSFKITEYLTTWTFGPLSFDWLVPMAPVMSMALITLEFTVGMMLIFGSFRRITAITLMLMMFFFTVTTLYDAITNQVTDCGCFGDAIKLTNWQTFYKNVVLDVFTVWIVITMNLRRKKRTERDILLTAFAIVIMVIFGLYNINNEPCIDFRAWKVGNQMIDLDESLQVKSYVTYRNTATGETEEFAAEELVNKMQDPEWESNWEWESSRVEDPHEIKADGFSMLDMDMNDHAQEFIGSNDYLLIVTIHHLDKVDEKGLQAIQRVVEYANENGIQLVLLSSALAEEVEAFLYENKLDELEFYFADVTAIETMARSNPGFLLMKDGKVLGKYHHRHYRNLFDYKLD
ncbi:MAG: DoxX family protein [Bacteroidales bacterium]|nr:DoxX family protein [Candidatus Colimorpha merdihippi]